MKDNGLHAWETNAQFWDNEMGDESNFFHRDLVRPYTEKLLEIKQTDLILDIACGNGNFSEYMAKLGATVVAFDYSENMIELAKKRRSKYLDKIDFNIADATNYEQIIKLKQDRHFDKAVTNMAIMDISDINPLFNALYEMLLTNGIFVFATHHPCFTFPNDDYFSESTYKGVAIEGQPVPQNYYHRSISKIFNIAFKTGFVLDGLYEVPFSGEKTPIIMIARFKKL